MANSYYDNSDAAGRFLAGETASGAEVDNKFDSVEAGFDLLPTPEAIYQGRVNFVADTGAADAYVVALQVAPSDYVVGLQVRFVAANANTGPATINVNALGVRNIRRQDGTALRAGDIPAGGLVAATYDGTRFLLDTSTSRMVLDAEIARVGAETAQGLSESAQAASEAAQGLSEAARDASQAAQSLSETARDKSQDWAETAYDTEVDPGSYSSLHWAEVSRLHSVDADGSATDAAASAVAALTSEGNAADSATAASGSASAAAGSATAANTSEGNAAGSATAAAGSATAAAGSATDAAASAAAALTSEGNAADSATAAAGSATAAAASEGNAANSETNAAASAAAALASEGAASTSETNAAASAAAALASEGAASTSETNAAASAAAALTSEGNAATSETNAAASATAAVTALDDLDDRYLGSKATAPTTDNDGDPLAVGALYFDTALQIMRVWSGSEWQSAYASLGGAVFPGDDASSLGSGTATDGQVLTADGAGGAAWEDLNTPSVTKATLTKTFAANEQYSLTLSPALSAGEIPVVSVTKEVPQSALDNADWDVNSTASNYELEDSAYNTTLTPSAVGNGTFTLGTGSFAASDVGKRIEGNGGSVILTDADGSYLADLSDFNDTSTIAAGDWTMRELESSLNGLAIISALIGTWDISKASYDSITFSVASQEAAPSGIFFKPDGTKMYIVGNSGVEVNQYTLSTAWDISTASFDSITFSVASQEANPSGIFFKPDGTKMYIVGTNGDKVNQYTLSTAWDISTASFDSVTFSVASQETFPQGIFFKPDGTKMYIVGSSGDDVNQYTLSTAWDISTASFDSVTFSVASEETAPQGIFFKPDGTKMYIVGYGVEVNQYTLSTAWDISTASYDSITFSVASQEGSPMGMFFKPDGTKMYIVGSNGDEVNQYTLGAFFSYTADYALAITSASGQIDSTFWTNINGFTATESLGDGNVYYAYSTDGRTTWKVIDDTDGERLIARNNAGTWEYNSNATYGSTTWTAASANTELKALKQALAVTANQMDKAQIEGITDPNTPTLGNTLDLVIGFRLTTASASAPSSDGIAINYDANTLNRLAVPGTDYTWDAPDTSTVRIESLGDYNLKVRVV